MTVFIEMAAAATVGRDVATGSRQPGLDRPRRYASLRPVPHGLRPLTPCDDRVRARNAALTDAHGDREAGAMVVQALAECRVDSGDAGGAAAAGAGR